MGGPPEAKKATAGLRQPAMRGRPRYAVKHRKRRKGFQLTVKVGISTPPAGVQRARDALRRALSNIEALHGPGDVRAADTPPA